MGATYVAQSGLTVAPIAGTKVGNLDSAQLAAATIKGNSSFAGKTNDNLKPEELALIMASTGFFNIEEIATFVGIAERESNCRPYASNDAEAIGMWQMIIKSGNWISTALPILVPGTSTAVSGKAILGWKLRNKNSKTKPSSDQMKTDGWTVTSVDEIFWIPFNQVSILAWQTLTYNGQELYKDAGKRTSSQSIRLWSNWGDGPWGRSHGGMDNANNFPYGVLTGVKPSTVKRVYESLGGVWIIYQAWALTALVDGYAKYPSPRSNADVAKKRDGTKYKAATYRNYWDVYIWVNFQKYKDTYFKDNIISTKAAGGKQMRYDRWGAGEDGEFCYPLGKAEERTLYAAQATVPDYIDPAPLAAVARANKIKTDAAGS